MTKSWKKYIGILSDNYIYFYNDKKNINYVYYYYIKNSDITVLNPTSDSDKDKYFVFKLKNKVNTANLAFDKKSTMDDWITMINKYRDDYEDALTSASDTSMVKKESTKSN